MNDKIARRLVLFICATMAAGLPVIATRCGGPEDFVDDSNGLLIPADDQKALEKALYKMIEQCSGFDRKKISATARNKFSPDTIACSIIEVYSRIINQTV